MLKILIIINKSQNVKYDIKDVLCNNSCWNVWENFQRCLSSSIQCSINLRVLFTCGEGWAKISLKDKTVNDHLLKMIARKSLSFMCGYVYMFMCYIHIYNYTRIYIYIPIQHIWSFSLFSSLFLPGYRQ